MNRVYFICFLLVLCNCSSKKIPKTKESCTKFGIILFSPKLNVSYFFPLQEQQQTFDLENFLEYEYEQGFVINWVKSEWRNNIIDNYSIVLGQNDLFNRVALVSVEYLCVDFVEDDSTSYFVIESDDRKKRYSYDEGERQFINIEGISSK